MAHFLYGVGHNATIRKLASLSSTDETSIAPLGDGFSSLWISAMGALHSNGSAFKGFAVDHGRKSLALTGAGDPDLPQGNIQVEGSYFRAERRGNSILASSDLFSMTPMLWTQTAEVTLFSDSLFVLTQMRAAIGASNELDEHQFRARFWLNSMAQQLMSANTPVKDIHYSTPGSHVRVDIQTLRSAAFKDPIDERLLEGVTDHAQAIRDAGQRMTSTIRAFVDAGALFNTAMSAGLDSRVCLAGVLAAGGRDSLYIGSRERNADEFALVARLGERFNLEINTHAPQIQGESKRVDRLASWAVSSLGIYDALYVIPMYNRTEKPIIGIGGHGAEAAKGNYGWRSLDDVRNMPESSRRVAADGLAHMSLPPDVANGSEWHYLGYRNPIHGSRGNSVQDFSFRPVLQQTLVGLAHSVHNAFPKPQKDSPSVIQELLIYLSPDLAGYDFDKKKKNIGFDAITDRLIKLGGQFSRGDLETYSVHGVLAPTDGPTKSFIEMARRAGLAGNFTLPNLTPHLDKARLQTSVDTTLLRSEIDQVDTESSSPLPASSHAASAIGKLLIPLLST